MINRDEELRLIDKFMIENDKPKCQTAFVAVSRQAEIPDREFVHSKIVQKWKWPNRWSKVAGNKE